MACPLKRGVTKVIKWQKGVAGTSFAGFDTFSTAASDTRVNLLFVPKFYETNVVLPLDEVSANQTDERVLDMVKLEIASRAQDMADSIGTLFMGDGTGNGGKDFLGLNAIVDDGGMKVCAVTKFGYLLG